MTPLHNETHIAVPSSTTNMGSQPEQALQRAIYVRVVDLANANNLDIEKVKVETAKKLEVLKMKAEEASLKENEEGSVTQPDDGSVQSCGVKSSTAGSSNANNRYQKRIVPSTGGFNLCLLVKGVKIVIEKTRVDKSQVRLAECEVGDETGTVSLRARDAQIDLLEEISNRNGAVVLRNCSVELYQGKFIRLAVSKWGKIASFPDGIKSTPTPPSSVNSEINLSIVDLNDVAGDEWFETTSTASGNQSHQQNRVAKESSPSDGKDTLKDQRSHHNQQHQRGGNSRRGRGYNDKRVPGYGGHGHGQRQSQQGHYKMSNRNSVQMQNMNHPNMVPPVNEYSQMYQHPAALPPYGFGQNDPHRQHGQHFNSQQQQKQQDFLLFQQYNIQMQLEAMRLYGQRSVLGNSQVQGYSPSHSHNMSSDGMSPRMETGSGNWANNMAPEPTMVAAQNIRGAQMISDDVPLRDYHSNVNMGIGMTHSSDNATTSQSNDDAWSIRREAQSPMMNPHAATFTSNYAVPNLSLPPQQYYAPTPAYSLGQYSSTASHIPSQEIPDTEHSEKSGTKSQSDAKA